LQNKNRIYFPQKIFVYKKLLSDLRNL